MALKSQHEKIIFGLKVKQLRQARKLSFAVLAANTGISISYLNEIEKGKKYPKEDKIQSLATALEVPPSDLTSFQLGGGLAPLAALLESNFLSELPLDLFGIEFSKVVEIIANAPLKVGAFISTLVDLSRNYAVGDENFFFATLRSYLELHHNYFEDIEQEVAQFSEKNQIPKNGTVSVVVLRTLLEKKYHYTIVEKGLDAYPELQGLRAVFLPKKKRLLLNSRLTEMQKAFQFGKELGFNFLNLKTRALTASLLKVKSFEEALNHFKAGYFSAALLINQQSFITDMEDFFSNRKWNGDAILELLQKYQSSPEMLFQRMTNILPRFFGLEKLYFIRVFHRSNSNSFKVDKELHLDQKHHPHSNGLREHYCRRWLSISLLNELHRMQQAGQYAGTVVGAQRSHYFGTDDEYLCITLARPAGPVPGQNVSVTLGLLIDEKVREKVNFWNDPGIPRQIVKTTCERCPISDCAERAAPPHIVEKRAKRHKVQETLLGLQKK